MAGPRFIADPHPLGEARDLEGLTLFFHRPSGTTHILAPPAPQILEALAGRAGDADELLARIGERFELEAENAAEAIAARLAELEAAGLVWRA
jgi:PqqD family protein of HPr-rel-A system